VGVGLTGEVGVLTWTGRVVEVGVGVAPPRPGKEQARETRNRTMMGYRSKRRKSLMEDAWDGRGISIFSSRGDENERTEVPRFRIINDSGKVGGGAS
jgi:hypothetical protein